MSSGSAAPWQHPDAIAAGRKLRDAGERVVAVVGWRVPVELVRAAGFHPVQVSADPAVPTPDADALLSAEDKPPVRALLQLVLSGALDFADLIVFAPPFAPVSMQVEELRRMAIITEAVPPTFYFETAMLRGDLQREFAVRRTRDLAQRLAALAGRPPGDDALEVAISATNRVRRAVKTLLQARAGADGPAGSEVIAAISAGNWLTPDEHVATLESVAADRKGHTRGPRLLLVSSNVLDDARVHVLVEQAGATIVAEDDIYGSCHADGEIAERSGDPLTAIGDFYHDNQPLQRTAPQELRRRWYHEQVARGDIDGVVIYAEDPIWGWDVPAMRAAAAAVGKATVTLSLNVRIPEQRATALGQLQDFVASLAEGRTA